MKSLITFLLALLITPNVQAQGVIWSADHWAENGSVLPGASWQISFALFSGVGTPTIFSMTLNTNDTGRTFFANAFNEAGFAGFAAGLTDGINGNIRFEDGGFGYLEQSERDFLGRSSLAPDLAGYNITQIGFRVSNFHDRYFAPDDVYYRRLDYSLDFYGAPVPEPGTWALLGLGGAATLLLRRKARRNR